MASNSLQDGFKYFIKGLIDLSNCLIEENQKKYRPIYIAGIHGNFALSLKSVEVTNIT
jgi:hypothetical protein